MKARLVLVLFTAIFSVGITLLSFFYVSGTMNDFDSSLNTANDLFIKNDFESAEEELNRLLSMIHSHSARLEMLVSHDAVHDLTSQLQDAKTSLAIRDLDDFKKAVSILKESIGHIKAHEKMSLSNIF